MIALIKIIPRFISNNNKSNKVDSNYKFNKTDSADFKSIIKSGGKKITILVTTTGLIWLVS